MRVVPYLFLPGTAEAALTHYAAIRLGDVVELGRCRDAPPLPGAPADWGDKVMHAELRGPGVSVIASDSA